MSFGLCVRVSMAHEKMNQKQLAESAGLDPSVISIMLKNEQCTWTTMQKVIEGLNTKPSVFFARGGL